MYKISTCVVLTLFLFSCVSTDNREETPEKNLKARTDNYRAPWSDYKDPSFNYFLANYLITNIDKNKNSIIDKYLRSQEKTYSQYIAAVEVGFDVSNLEKQAIIEANNISNFSSSRLYSIKTIIDFEKYDKDLGGFPIFSPFNESGGYSFLSNLNQKGVDTKGFYGAEVWLSKKGWVIPAEAKEAFNLIKGYSKTYLDRKAAVVIVYSLDSCFQYENKDRKLFCTGSIKNIYGYNEIKNIQSHKKPVVELVRRNET